MTIALAVQGPVTRELLTGIQMKVNERQTLKKSCIQNITSMDMKRPASEGRHVELGSI